MRDVGGGEREQVRPIAPRKPCPYKSITYAHSLALAMIYACQPLSVALLPSMLASSRASQLVSLPVAVARLLGCKVASLTT